MTDTVFYRFEDYLTGDEYAVRVELRLRELRVLKTTRCGVWLDDYGRRRFVLNDSYKKFAARTVDAARESFIARKRRQVSIYRHRVAHAENALEQAIAWPTKINRLNLL